MIQTPNYGLPQFAEQDLFNVENFNEAFNKIDKAVSDIQETFNINGSGSDLTTQEVVRARIDKPSLNEKIQELHDVKEANKKNINLYKPREEVGYALEVANLSGQNANAGKGPNDPAQQGCRAVVVHNYNDSNPVIIDNVGDAPSIFIRNARNEERRTDKPFEYIGKGNYLTFQQGYMNDNNLDHSFVTMYNMDYLGNMYWRNNRSDVDTIKFMTVCPGLAKKYNFVFSSYYYTKYLVQFHYENNKSALNVALDPSGNTWLMSPTNGLKFSAYKNNVNIESIEGSVILKGTTGVYTNVNNVNLPLARFVSSKPATPTSSGSKGDYFCDSLNLYVCYNPDMWAKFNVSAW